MQLTDEPDKRCYPLDSHLLCRSCHISHLNENQPELEVSYYKTSSAIKSIIIFFISERFCYL